jgi:hypothetical protein
VLRRSWPKFESQLLVRSTGQRIPSGTASFFGRGASLTAPGADEVINADLSAVTAHVVVVVAAIEMHVPTRAVDMPNS